MDLFEAKHYAEHIRGVVADNLAHMPRIIDGIIQGGAIECVDDNCEHGAEEAAGSVWLLYSNGLIDQLGAKLQKANIARISVLTHEDCGFLAVMRALLTRKDQNFWADGGMMRRGANRSIQGQLSKFGVTTDFAPRDKSGSATGYMEFMKAHRG